MDDAATNLATYDLAALPSVGVTVEVYRTSASEDLVHLSPIPIQNWALTTATAPYSVTTFVIPLARS